MDSDCWTYRRFYRRLACRDLQSGSGHRLKSVELLYIRSRGGNFIVPGAMLAAAGDSAAEPIPVAIETPRGLLVAALRATGRPIYPINPLAVARYRERTSVSGKKSDHVDAMALANILRTDAHPHSIVRRTQKPLKTMAQSNFSLRINY